MMVMLLTGLKDWPFLSVVVLLLLLVVTHWTFRWMERRTRSRDDALRRRTDVNREEPAAVPRDRSKS